MNFVEGIVGQGQTPNHATPALAEASWQGKTINSTLGCPAISPFHSKPSLGP